MPPDTYNLMLHSIINKLTYTCTEKNIRDLLDINVGVTVLRLNGDLSSEELGELKAILVTENNEDMMISPVIGEVYQDFFQKQIFRNKLCIELLTRQIEKVIKEEIYRKNNLVQDTSLTFDSVIMQYYPYIHSLRPFAIPPHIDHKGFVELVVILLIDGESLFYTAEDKSCRNERLYEARAFDLIVMRGYRFCGIEERPVHYVKKIQKDGGRITLGFRVLSKDRGHVKTLEETFGVI